MTLIKFTLKQRLIQFMLIACLLCLAHTQCSRTYESVTYTSTPLYNCDPRCLKHTTAGMFCCLSASLTTNNDCLYGCNTDSTTTLVGKVYQWPTAVNPRRCDSYCPPRYYVLPTHSSGQQCLSCHPWCFDCTNQFCYTCTSCDTTAYRLNSTGCYNMTSQTYGTYNPCPDGYYGLHIQVVCVPCPTGCATCAIYLTWEMPGLAAGFSASSYNQNNINCTGDPLCGYTLQCYSCNPGYTYLQGACYQNTQCLTYSYYTSTGLTFTSASCNCFTNYQSIGSSICIKCHILCLSCSGSTSSDCLTCPIGSSNTTTATPSPCGYNTTYSQIQNWGATTPTITTTASTSGFYKTGGAVTTNVDQMACTSSTYVFGYYGYNNNGTRYYSSSLTEGVNLFPDAASLIYNKASLAAHYGIHIRATLLFIDQWTNNMAIIFTENGKNQLQYTYRMQGIAGEYLCGLNYDDHLDVVDDWFRHTSSSISSLTIKANTPKFAWGIKELILHVMICHTSCSTCTGPTSLDCATCPTNQILVNGICVCDSPNGYFNLSGTCTTNCGTKYENPYTYTCVDACSWPHAFGFLNGTSRYQCLVSCPTNYYKNYTNSMCISSCFISTISNPANNFYMFGGADRMCNQTCPNGTFGDPKSGSCVRTCPTYNTSTNDGYFSSGSFCYESCPLATLFAYVPQRICLTSCPSGYYKNYVMKNGTNSSICEQQCSVTLGGLFLYGDNATGFCTNYCSTGTYGDIDTNLCLAVCNSSAFGQSISLNATFAQRLCVVNCSVTNNLYGNPQTGFCVTPPNCPTNFYADPLIFQCTRNCTGDLYFGDNSTKKCITTACSSNGFKDNQTKICLKTCTTNGSVVIEYGDPLTGYCVANCYGAYYADNQFNMQCVLICSASPASTFGLNNVCVRNCSGTTWADVYNPSRTCTPSCFGNSTYQTYGLNDTRACVLKCPDYQFADISSGVGLCKFGCPVNPVTTASGLFGNIVTNKCQIQCPSPYFGDQTGNRTCVLRCPWPYFAQYCTQSGMTFTVSTKRQCQLACACGWSDNATQLCVWNSSGCANLTFAHETNHKCVVSSECAGYGDPVSRYCINPCFKDATVIYFADNSSKMCVTICPSSPNYFADNSTQQCVFTCPNSTVRDPQGMRRCVNLTNCSVTPVYLYGDETKDLCVNPLNCSDGYYADNNTHQCIQICPGPTFLYADNVTKQCVAVCELGWYALNISSGKGICSLSCPQEQWADNKTISCTSRCSANTYGVNYTGTWSAFTISFGFFGTCQNECPTGQFARDADNLCVTDCGPGLWGDSLSKTCKTTPFDCPAGYYANSNTNLCVVPLNCSKISGVQYVADNSTKSCVAKCPNTTLNFADLNKFLCVAKCPQGYYGYNSTLNCQVNCTFVNASNISVYDGSFADPQINICVQICSGLPISTFGQNITFTCVEARYCPTDTWAQVTVHKRKCYSPCPSPNMFNANVRMYGDNLTKTCVASCPTYTFADLSLGYGICVYVCPRLSNNTLQFADNSTKSCVTICPATNYTFGDNSTLSCVYNCPNGTFAQPLPYRYCVTTCSLGTWGETVKYTCVDSPLLCPTINGTYYYADNTTTMCVKTCPAATSNAPDYWGQNTTRSCLTTCLLPSGVQSGFKWNKTRVCIKECPDQIGQEGSYSDQGMCYYVCMTSNYYRDPQYNRSCQSNCTFSPNKQYADNTTMKCVAKCPTFPMQLYAYDISKTCESTCPSSYRKYLALKTCVSVCPNGTFFNPDTYQCVSQCPLTTNTNQTLFADASLAEPKCVINTACSSSYYADSNTGYCVQNCSMNQWIYGKDCVKTCPNGYYGNPNNQSCVLPQYCPTNYFADNVTITCVAECSGSYADSTTYSCVFVCPKVGSTVYYADPSTRKCSTTCTNTTFVPLIKNLENQLCVSQCEPGSFMDPFRGSCQASCTNSYYADNSTNLCVKTCPVSPNLYGQNTTYTCVQNCLNASQFKFIGGRVCVTACPSGTFRNNLTRNCQYTCTGFTYADTTTSYCVSNCTPKYAYDLTNECKSSCSTPYYKDPTTFKCVLQCPTYPSQYLQVIEGTDRRCDTNCPSGSYRNFQTLSCVALCSAAPIMLADKVTGNCQAVCSANYFGYTAQRTCLDKCPNGMFADNLTRMCVSKCDPVLGLFGDPYITIPACVSVCASGTFADPFTQTCTYTCITFPKMYAYDNGDTTNPIRTCVYSCPYSYVADNSTSKCKLTCSSPTLPYVDQAAQQCVAKCTSPVYQYAYMPTGQTVNGQCVKFCPNNTYALLTNNTCVPKCPDGLYSSTTNNTCYSTCNLANNQYADPYNNKCVQECYHLNTYYSYADQFSRKCVQTCPKDKGLIGDRITWKCVKRCTNLSQYADPSGFCTGQCPSNYFADPVSQTCVSNCSISTLSYGDTVNRICVSQCPDNTLYADDATRLCVASTGCPSGFFGFNTTRVCLAICPTTPNLFGDPISKTCVSVCQATPVKYYADYVSRTCLTKCPSVPALFAQNNTQLCIASCPNATFADNYTRYCIAVCSTIPKQTFADNTTNKCVSTCPIEPNYYASNYTWECVLACPSSPSMYADNSTRSCVYYCPRGIINTFADDSTRRCVDICPNNTFNENSTQKCVTQCLTGYADPRTKFCIAICPRYTYGDNSTKSCVTGCPVYNGQQTYAQDNNNLCMYDCLSIFNTLKDITTKRCVKICPINQSLFADVSQRNCTDICPIYPLTYADFSTRYCVSKCPSVPALFSISITNRVCVAVCPNGTWSDNNSRSCLTVCLTTPQTFGDNSTWACVSACPTKPYTFANNDTHICVPVCPSNPDYYGDNVTRKCVFQCPNTTFADPTTRRCVTTCPDGYYGQNSTRRCVRSCPWREFADNLTHLCLAKCSIDPIFYGNPDNLLCVSQCPQANNSFGNPLTQQCVNFQTNGTSGCPVTYFSDVSTRLCVQVCPMANNTYADNSTWKCVTQCPIIYLPSRTYNTYSDNSTMKCVDVCPAYPDFYGEPYSRTCVHFCLKPTSNYSGSFSDNSTRTCVQTCPVVPDYFSDNSTGRCVFYCPRYPLTFADNSTRRCVSQCPSSPDIYGDLKSLRCVPQCPRDQDTFADYSTRLCVLTCPSSPPLYAQNITLICVAKCPNNSYSDNSSRRCVKVCPRFPQTYGDPSTNQCVTTCPSSPDLYADPNTQQCIPRCPTDFYAQNNTRRCLRSCLFNLTGVNLTNYADNLTNRCVSRCPASELTYGDNETQTCVKQCPADPFTYADNITQTCVTVCNNVTNGGYADNVTRICVQKCPDFSYGDITTRYCVRYCPPLWYAHTSTNLCVQNCPSPLFADNSTWRCVQKCPVGQNLFGEKINNTCVGMCPQGTYASEQNQECVERCPNSSQTTLRYNTWGFNDTNYCVNQCPILTNAELYGYPVAQVCVSICPHPYYPNITDHLCYRCPEECASCHYPQLCITCIADHYLYAGACVESCPAFPVITYANPNRVCGTAYQCTQGYYALNATKSCVQTCPAGFFVNIASQTCDSCMRGCLSCQNSASCIYCNDKVSIWSDYKCYLFCSARNRFYGTTGCVAKCPNGTYLNITTCQVCSSNCKTCIVTAQNCLICANGFYRSNGICVSSCPVNTAPKMVDNSQTCVSCNGSCTTKPLTFSTTQYATGNQFTVQVQFSEPVNVRAKINQIIQLSQKKTKRLLETSYDNLNYTIIDLGNGLYSFVFNDYNPASNSQIQVQITNPSAIVGSSGQIPSTTRSSFQVDTSIIYSSSDYNKHIDGAVYAICIFAFILLLFTFGMDHSIWMPMYDYLQLIMALIIVNINFPPDLIQSVFKTFASSLAFLPNFFAKSFSSVVFNKNYINNNIYSVMQDSSFLRVMGHLYFIVMMVGIFLVVVFILSKKCFSKTIKKWCKQFIRQIFWKKHLFALVYLFFLPVFLLGIFNMQLYSYFKSEPIQGFSIFSSYLFMIALLVPVFYWLYKVRKIIKTHPIIYLMLQKAYNFILYQQTVLIDNKNNNFTHENNEVDLSNAREPKINELLVFPFPIETKVGPWQLTQPFLSILHKFMTALFLAIAFTNPIIQIVLLILGNVAYMIYFMVRRPFYRVKNRQYNNEIYIHNLVVLVVIQIVLLVIGFIGPQISTSTRVFIGDIICGLVIEGGLVNIIYFSFRTYYFYHQKLWKPFVRSDIFKINYTMQHLQWTQQYQQKEKKLASEVKSRQEFLAAIRVETGQALANMVVREMSVTTNTKEKIRAPKLRPSRAEVVSKEYGEIVTSLANEKQRSQKSIASSERLSKAERKKVRDFIFGQKQVNKNDDNYQKLIIIQEKSEIHIQGVSEAGQQNQQTEYQYEYIEQQFPQGTPMQQILQGCKKGDVVLPL